jgi:hypothetical protein
MERVAFLIEKTGETITCLLNPESLVQRRRAGLRGLAAATGVITGAALSDDPVAATGGGTTEYDLDLLFDVDLAREEAAAAPPAAAAFETAPADPDAAAGGETVLVPAPPATRDVRDLTRPFWALSENAAADQGYGAPPVVRMIWGRAWNVLGVVVAVAERLERFSDAGVPRRSWLRLRLRRVSEAAERPAVPAPATPQFELPPPDLLGTAGAGIAVALAVAPDGLPVDRLDRLAAEHYGDPGAWRLIAAVNDIDDPLNIAEGTVLALPRLEPGSP